MKKFFEHIFTLITGVIALILSILWYLNDYGYEALISIIIFGSSIIVNLLFRFNKSKEKNNNKITTKGNNNTIIQDNIGSININRRLKK